MDGARCIGHAPSCPRYIILPRFGCSSVLTLLPVLPASETVAVDAPRSLSCDLACCRGCHVRVRMPTKRAILSPGLARQLTPWRNTTLANWL